jgi:hypothetical protein
MHSMLALRTIGGAEQILLPTFHEPFFSSRWRPFVRPICAVRIHYAGNDSTISWCLYLGIDFHRGQFCFYPKTAILPAVQLRRESKIPC